MKPRLLTRKPCLMPTFVGWLVLSVSAATLSLLILLNLNAFLSPVNPSPSDVLVVEGWLPDYALDSAAALFYRDRYRKLAVIGGVIERGSYLVEYKTFAELGAAAFKRIGIPDSSLFVIPAPPSAKDRTWVSAVALTPWIRSQGLRSLDVCSLGAHARRTRYLFQKAAGDSVRTGIISIPDAGYNGKKWWASSLGFRTVTGELIAYLYVRVLFRP
ncbi:MAG: hypothetical protein JXA71_05495 [Chitinispirillaceae bacterium]|nr:hypothetical protein [Chitinispirillaceae bacterium]